jgi:hypothetical protein
MRGFMSNDERLVTYVSGELSKWVKREAKKLGMTESTFIRFLILQFKKNEA